MPERWERKTHAPGAPRGHSRTKTATKRVGTEGRAIHPPEGQILTIGENNSARGISSIRGLGFQSYSCSWAVPPTRDAASFDARRDEFSPKTIWALGDR
eukprot:1028275-Prymnesium_polylepis.1